MRPAVLIVDDSLTVRMDLGEAMEAAGFVTTLAPSLAVARRNLAAQSFSLIILDVMLPDGDGVALLAEIRSRPATATVPVVMLSAEVEVQDRVRGLTSGADAYLGKPYDTAQLVARARELVRRHKLERMASDDPTILVIDDSATFRDALSAALEAAGYRVVTAGTGEEGLRTAATLKPRAVIVDGVMPGIDGTTVVRRLRMDAALRRTPCVVLTGSEAFADELQALDAGADAYVRKAEDMAVILARVAAVVRRPDATPAVGAVEAAEGTKKVLAVDDSPTYLQALGDQLREEGYEVRLASSGEEALEMLSLEPVDCILLDLRMPGLSGEEACRRIKSSPAWRDIPLMILTAAEEREAMISGMNAGADDYVTKSASPEVLKARLRAQLRRRQFEDENRLIREELLQKEIEANEARAAKALAETRAALLGDLERKNEELERINEQLQRARAQAERQSEFKSKFLANMSHELRTPLNAIIGFSDLLEQQSFGPLNARQQSYVQYVLTSGRHLLELINDILDLSKVEAGRLELKREPTLLGATASAVVGVVAPLAEKQGVTLTVSVPPDLPSLLVDEVRIRQVLYNLLSNGIKFTPKGGEVRLAATADGVNVKLVVEDTGIGIAAADLPRLFREFEQLESPSGAKQAGTGLGLVLTRRLVEMHGGSVSVRSELGKGTAFTVILPVVPAAESLAMPRSDQGPPESLVLVVEDDAKAAELIAEHMRAAGLPVAFARDAEEAVRLADELRPAAITLDILMPRVDGWAVLSRLKGSPALARIPVVIISVVDEPDRGLLLGASDYLLKPVSREALLGSLEATGVALQRVKGLRVLLVSRNGEGIEAQLKNAGCEVRRAANLSEDAVAHPHLVDLAIVDDTVQHSLGRRIEFTVDGRVASIPVLQVVDADRLDRAAWQTHFASLAHEDALQPHLLVRAVRRAVDHGRAAQTLAPHPIVLTLRSAIQRAQREHKQVALVLVAPDPSLDPSAIPIGMLRRRLRADDFIDAIAAGVVAIIAYGVSETGTRPLVNRMRALVGELLSQRIDRASVLVYPTDGTGADEMVDRALRTFATEGG